MNLYPLKFKPIPKYRIWGGDKLNSVLNKNFNQKQIGESWEISDVNSDQTLVSNGFLKGKSLKEIISKYKSNLVGNNSYEKFGNNFPLLIKFIDAKLPLSIQVHPHDKIAKERHDSFGKNEMWYVMDADPGSEIIVGFKKNITKKKFIEKSQSEYILDVLNKEKTKKGDAYYIPTGRVHAIGAGILLAEIQQTSDITYRIHDYNRIDKKTGETRKLHNDLATDVIDFTVYNNYKTFYKNNLNKNNRLIHTDYFKSNFIRINHSIVMNYSKMDSFIVYICTSGQLKIKSGDELYKLSKGETILIPSQIKQLEIIPSKQSEIIEVHM